MPRVQRGPMTGDGTQILDLHGISVRLHTSASHEHRTTLPKMTHSAQKQDEACRPFDDGRWPSSLETPFAKGLTFLCYFLNVGKISQSLQILVSRAPSPVRPWIPEVQMPNKSKKSNMGCPDESRPPHFESELQHLNMWMCRRRKVALNQGGNPALDLKAGCFGVGDV